MNRKQLAQLIIQKLEDNRESLAKEFAMSDQISSCVIDNLLDEQIVHFIYEAFPQKEEMSQRNSIRELKYVAAQMNLYNPLLEEIIYAFQDPKFLSLLSEITGIPQLLPDEYLYAGGISLMDRGGFLNPHIDNSHDKDRQELQSSQFTVLCNTRLARGLWRQFRTVGQWIKISSENNLEQI